MMLALPGARTEPEWPEPQATQNPDPTMIGALTRQMRAICYGMLCGREARARGVQAELGMTERGEACRWFDVAVGRARYRVTVTSLTTKRARQTRALRPFREALDG